MPRRSGCSWICVVETRNAPGPQRFPGKARLTLFSTGVKPGTDLDAYLAKSSRMRRLGASRIRYDLMPPPREPGGRDMPVRTPGESAKLKAASRRLPQRIAGEGYTVNGDTKTWRVYVVELHPPKKPAPNHKPA